MDFYSRTVKIIFLTNLKVYGEKTQVENVIKLLTAVNYAIS
jgi:hypothetical protein